jgi:ribosome-binding ATPase YchF (GTP1/OBG family)
MLFLFIILFQKDPLDLSTWTEIEVQNLVRCFIKHRFPMILLLNKADPAAYKSTKEGALFVDQNISAIVEKYETRVTPGSGKSSISQGGMRCVVGSANAELFLRSCAHNKYIKYKEGDSQFHTLEGEGRKGVDICIDACFYCPCMN